MVLCGILGHLLEVKQHRKAEMVWVVGGWPCPSTAPHMGQREQSTCTYLTENTISKVKQASSIQNMPWKSTPWRQLIRNLRSVILKTSYLMQTDAKGGKREEKKMQNPVEPTEFVEMGFSPKNRSYLSALGYHITSLPLCTQWKDPDWMLTPCIWEKTILFPILKAKGLKIDSARLFHIMKPNEKAWGIQISLAILSNTETTFSWLLLQEDW